MVDGAVLEVVAIEEVACIDGVAIDVVVEPGGRRRINVVEAGEAIVCRVRGS